ncbi:MAG: DUF3667 domain-containing protein [Ignavibacteriae bacterium]|nr:DUF3667 domain-containing protein [Ignavibacteriota bacterium]
MQKVNFNSLLSEIPNTILQVDKGFFFTIKELFVRPGYTIREYLEGKRIRHFKPIAFALILSTIYALLTYYTDKNTILGEVFSGLADGFNNKAEKVSTFSTILNWMGNHYAYSTLLILLVFSSASSLAFIKSKYNYFEHLILNLYIEGQRMVIYLIFIPLLYFITDENYLVTVQLIQLTLTILLTFWTYLQFFDTKKLLSKILLTLLTYVYFLILLFLIMILASGISRFFI